MSTLENNRSVLSNSQTFDIRAPTIKYNSERLNQNQIWIQPEQLQQTTCPYANMSFDHSYGLNTIDPIYNLNTNFSDFKSSFKPKSPITSDHQTQNWHLEDTDLLIQLPESLLHNVDLEQIKKVNKDGLDNIMLNVKESHHNPEVQTKNLPMTKLPKKIHPKDLTLKIKSSNNPPEIPNVLRPRIVTRIIKEAERKLGTQKLQIQNNLFNTQSSQRKSMNQMEQNRIQFKTPRKVILPKTKKLPVRKAVKATQTCTQENYAVFHREKFNKIYELMKKLDVDNTIFSSTPPYEALKNTQQRQIWLQTWNRIMADVNISESTDIFTLYHRYPFRPLPQNPQTSQGTKKPMHAA